MVQQRDDEYLSTRDRKQFDDDRKAMLKFWAGFGIFVLLAGLIISLT